MLRISTLPRILLCSTRSSPTSIRKPHIHPPSLRATIFQTQARTMTTPSIPSQMRALQIQEQGDLSVLQMHDIPVPKLGPRDVLVEVEWAGVNYIDTYQRGGLYKLKMPFVLGNEPAGTIVSLGDELKEDSLKVGDRVICYSTGGGFAQYASVPRAKVSKLPDNVSTKDGATLALQGMTALSLVREAYPIQKGDWVLVHAAAGGVGLLLCSLAKNLGANVIGTTSTSEKAALAKEAGADHVILYAQGESVVEGVNKLTDGLGVHAIYDGVGKDTWEDDFIAIRRKGTIVTFGNASGAVEPFAPLKLAAKNVKVCRPTLPNYVFTQEEFESYASELFDLVARGVIKSRVHAVYKLDAEGIKQAQVDITGRGTTGKLLVQAKA